MALNGRFLSPCGENRKQDPSQLACCGPETEKVQLRKSRTRRYAGARGGVVSSECAHFALERESSRLESRRGEGMASDDAAKKRKPRGRSEASGAAVAAVPEAGVAVTAVAAGALAEDTGKKKKKKKRKRQQVLEGEREGAVGAGLGATCVGNDDNEPRTTSGSKRRKKKGQGGKRQRPAMAAAATASITTACGTPGAGAAVSSQPLPTLACTGKVAEYAAIGGSTTAPPPASVERETSSQSTKKKKKKKAKKDKRDKKGRAEPSCHVTHTPPSVPGRAGENASFNETHDHADASSGSKHDSNRHDDDPVLEGIVHDGTMYLVDAAKKVFSAQRDEGGNLVEVGTYDGEAVTIDPVDLPAAGASSPCGDDPAEAGVRGAAGSSTRGDKGQGKAKGKKDGAKVEDASETESGAVVDYPFEVEVGPRNSTTHCVVLFPQTVRKKNASEVRFCYSYQPPKTVHVYIPHLRKAVNFGLEKKRAVSLRHNTQERDNPGMSYLFTLRSIHNTGVR